MACGLGAIILVFMLVKHNAGNTVLETELLQADLDRLEAQEQQIRGRLEAVKAEMDQADKGLRAASGQIAQLESSIEDSRQTASQSQSKIAQLKDTIEKTEIAETSDVVESPKPGEETYLMGLKVEGRRIAILVDASASMTDETLIEIIRRKNSPDAVKKQGPKWKRTREVVKWLLARVPDMSEVAVMAFNEKAIPLGGGWQRGSDGAAMARILRELDDLVPTGATNLQAGLNGLAPLRAGNLYVVTDGLPTAGESNYRSLNPFSDCPALWGSSATISGACRTRLFRQTIAESGSKGLVVNVILLPIEGDPEAAPEFWAWSALSGGLLISPAGNWP
ncbi:MAG: hypothetical protein RBS99_15015 [Rhodospirillales bacterium]|jgi:hypothetical protein|nr:hypothetical protein [Rhodospirillales bacterium]